MLSGNSQLVNLKLLTVHHSLRAFPSGSGCTLILRGALGAGPVSAAIPKAASPCTLSGREGIAQGRRHVIAACRRVRVKAFTRYALACSDLI